MHYPEVPDQGQFIALHCQLIRRQIIAVIDQQKIIWSNPGTISRMKSGGYALIRTGDPIIMSDVL